jgi:hypothetical protein
LGFAEDFGDAGESLWFWADPEKPSAIHAVAAAGDQVVLAGERTEADKPGLLVRLDQDGVLQNTIAVGSALGPVAVTGEGTIWVIERSVPPKLLSFTLENKPGVSGTLDVADYEKLVLASDGGLYLLAHTDDDSSFTVSKYDQTGTKRWQSEAYEGATASGLGLLANGALVVAGHSKDKTHGVLAWYDASDGELLYEDHELQVQGQSLSFFNDVAVAPSGAFAVAVGAAGMNEVDTNVWVYEFEI